MTTMRTLMLLIAGLGAAALAGCGANVPEHPTWQDDVRPIMVARCVRCHTTTPQGDPESRGGKPGTGDFSHASLDDFMPLDKIALRAAPDRIRSDDPLQEMPPPPAAKLADWQIETIARYETDNSDKQS